MPLLCKQLLMLGAYTIFLFGAGHAQVKKELLGSKTAPTVEFASAEIQTFNTPNLMSDFTRLNTQTPL